MHLAKYSAEYLVAAILAVTLTVCNCRAELTPPYFNLAEGRHISATATCGVGSDGPELYCKLVGANTENDVHHNYSLVQGQVNIVTDLNFLGARLVVQSHIRRAKFIQRIIHHIYFLFLPVSLAMVPLDL